MKILVLVGGISRSSLNRKVFGLIEKLNKTGLAFTQFDISSLPYYSQDLESDLPEPVVAMKKLALESDGVMIITPEYNRSIPGVLKNALDWGSRPYGTSAWGGKPTAILGAAASPFGTFGAQQDLRLICSQLNMPVMNQPALYIDATINVTEGGFSHASEKHVGDFLAAFEKWVKKLR